MLQHGDIVIMGGSNGILTKMIRYFDRSKYTHCGIIYIIDGNPYILDMWTNGMNLVPFKKRSMTYKDFKLCIIRPDVSESMKGDLLTRILHLWSNVGDIRYDYWLLPRIAIRNWTGWDFWTWGKGDSFICSEGVARYYMDNFCDDFKGIECLTPGDIERSQCAVLKNRIYEI